MTRVLCGGELLKGRRWTNAIARTSRKWRSQPNNLEIEGKSMKKARQNEGKWCQDAHFIRDLARLLDS